MNTVFVRFLVDADASAGLLSKVVQPFARRDITPDRMWSHRNGETVHLEVAVEQMPKQDIHLVAGNLQQVIGVRSVTAVVRDSNTNHLHDLSV